VYNHAYPYQLADCQRACTVRKVVKMNRGKGCEEINSPGQPYNVTEALEITMDIMPQPQDPAASAIWKSKDHISHTLITAVIKDEQIIHISDCLTAAVMWNALHMTHEPN
jgi:hypothetical protein